VGLGSGDGNCDGQDDVTALDTDGDRIPDFYANGTPHDNCPGDPNPKQENNDGNPWFAGPHDDMGDACDPDDDNDGAPDGYDNCPLTYNPGQEDTVDHPPAMHPNGVGDACDDPDGDGLFDHDWVTTVSDNCPSVSNHDQTDSDGDSVGDVCDPDRDGDGVCNVGGPLQPGTLGAPYGCVVGTPGYDNCLSKPNSDQADADNDSWGDVCDNCPTQWSIPNIDTDQDQYCDEYDPDADNDGICDNGGPLDPGPGVPVGCDPGPSGHDNCPTVWNPDQTDLDNDGIGRDCDGDELGAMAEHAIQENYDFWSHTTPMIDLELGPPQPHDGHPDYLGLGYLCEVDVELSVPFVAQVLDNMGNVIAQTGLDMDRPMQRSLIFAPAPYWVATGMKRTPGGALSEPLAADETGYRLRFAPLGGFVPNQAYTLTLEVHAGVTHQIYLPLVIRQH
jgi:hypothetical protein